jgi:hypothetical protein
MIFVIYTRRVEAEVRHSAPNSTHIDKIVRHLIPVEVARC